MSAAQRRGRTGTGLPVSCLTTLPSLGVNRLSSPSDGTCAADCQLTPRGGAEGQSFMTLPLQTGAASDVSRHAHVIRHTKFLRLEACRWRDSSSLCCAPVASDEPSSGLQRTPGLEVLARLNLSRTARERSTSCKGSFPFMETSGSTDEEKRKEQLRAAGEQYFAKASASLSPSPSPAFPSPPSCPTPAHSITGGLPANVATMQRDADGSHSNCIRSGVCNARARRWPVVGASHCWRRQRPVPAAAAAGTPR